jgi:predicted aminopeptidase
MIAALETASTKHRHRATRGDRRKYGGAGRRPITCALRRAALLAIGLTAALVGGCERTQYLVRQSIGQLGVLLRSVPIDDVIARGERPEEELAKLRLIVEAREFARGRLGLRVGRSFQKFHDTGGRAMAYNLSACPKDSLRPRRWWFPIIGWIDYIGYFDKADAEVAEKRLQAEDLDTRLGEVDAFSSLGWLPDPVHSPLLRRDELGIVEVVVHELAHNTVYANGQSDFNESLATFIGREGAVLFYKDKGDEDSVRRLRERYDDQNVINEWLIELRESLTEYYGRDIPREEKIAGRDAVFEQARKRLEEVYLPRMHDPQRYRGWTRLQPNNATVRLNLRYNQRQDLFAKLYEGHNREFASLLGALRTAAGDRDPFDWLRRHAEPAGQAETNHEDPKVP